MKKIYSVIQAPCFTEKADFLKTQYNCITIKVHVRSNKFMVKRALEILYNVKVSSVHLLKMKGKIKKRGHDKGKLTDWKKAYVRIRDGNLNFIEDI